MQECVQTLTSPPNSYLYHFRTTHYRVLRTVFFLTEKKTQRVSVYYVYYLFTVRILPTINDSHARLQTSLFLSTAAAIIRIRVYYYIIVIYFSLSMNIDVLKINYHVFLFVRTARRYGSFQRVAYQPTTSRRLCAKKCRLTYVACNCVGSLTATRILQRMQFETETV